MALKISDILFIKSNQIIHYTRCITPKRVTSWRGPSSHHCARATQLLSKKCRSGGEPLATLCPIWPARDLNLRPPAPETNALPLDQLAGLFYLSDKVLLSDLILSFFYIYLFWTFYMFSLNDWKVWFLKDPHFGATNFLPNFIYPSYLLMYPEIVMCIAYTSKNCEFWRPHLRETLIVVLPSCFFILSFHTCLFWKFHQSRSSGSVLNFGVLVCGESLHFGNPTFCQILSFLRFCLSWKFHVSSMCG